MAAPTFVARAGFLGGLALVSASPVRAQSASEVAAWHNLPVKAARVGRARAWTRELQIPGTRRPHGRFGWIVLPRCVVGYVEGEMCAFDSTNGRTIWHRPHPFGSGNAIVDGVALGSVLLLYAEREDGSTVFAALDPKTGREKWRTACDGACRYFQKVGNDVVCEVRTKGRAGGGDEASVLAILDCRSGAWKCRLSPTDQSANRRTLLEKCPALVDRWVLFGDRRTRNGAFLDGYSGGGGMDRKAWIVGDALYVYTSIEDFPMDGRTGDTGLTKFDLSGSRNGDLWTGEAMGRQLNSAPCRHFNQIWGLYKGRLLTSYTVAREQANKLARATTEGTLPLSGRPVFEPLPTPGPDLYPIAGADTSLGRMFMTEGFSYPSAGPYPEKAYLRRAFLLTPSGWVAQRPVPRPPAGMPPWIEWGVCEDGAVYASWLQPWNKPGRLLIHLEPFVVRKRR